MILGIAKIANIANIARIANIPKCEPGCDLGRGWQSRQFWQGLETANRGC